MQRVVGSITSNLQICGAIGDWIVHFDGLGRKGEQSGVLQSPFDVRISIDLIYQCLAGNPLNITGPHPSEELLNGLGLLPDSKLGLIIGETIQTAGVEVKFHARLRIVPELAAIFLLFYSMMSVLFTPAMHVEDEMPGGFSNPSPMILKGLESGPII